MVFGVLNSAKHTPPVREHTKTFKVSAGAVVAHDSYLYQLSALIPVGYASNSVGVAFQRSGAGGCDVGY